MSMNYAQLVDALNNLLQTQSSADFTDILPRIIDDAEQRIYRELNFLAQRQENISLVTTAGSRYIDLSPTSLPCMVVEQIALFDGESPTVPTDTFTTYVWRGPGNLNITTAYPGVQTGTFVINQTTPQNTTVTLPAGAGPWLVVDGAGNASTYPITVIVTGGVLIAGNASYGIDFNWQEAGFVWVPDDNNYVVGL